jgi:hypothetical protein
LTLVRETVQRSKEHAAGDFDALAVDATIPSGESPLMRDRMGCIFMDVASGSNDRYPWKTASWALNATRRPG